MPGTLRIGIDVGGTFTDLFLLDEATGAVVRHKLPSTPQNPHQAPIKGLAEILEAAKAKPGMVRFVGLGTTVATNALLERKGALTGLITTEGFRDLLEIGRQKRPHVYDVRIARAAPLVPRERRLEVCERIAGDSAVITPLDRDGVVQAVEDLREARVDSIAICFLNSYANPAHELQAAALVREVWPDVLVTTSQELLPEFREYERLSSTVVNAYLMPMMKRYLARFKAEVADMGILETPFVMNSGGGVISPELAGERPVDMLFSGPSGGVSGAVYLAGLTGLANLITFDMGGTSTDVCLVQDGRPEVTNARTIGGLPLKSMALDVHTVGAGGSSIAWIDPGGLLRVGPQSAGAEPGPACYGTGGEDPTVTDANVVLGRLNRDYLLDGALKIDARRSEAAIERVVARAKGLSLHEAAAAILAVSNTSIAQAIQFVSVERGLDPADFVLVAFGGAGPLHAGAVARELGMRVLVPESPGVLCAMGVLTKDIQIDLSQTHILRPTDADRLGRLGAIYDGLETKARETFSFHRLATDRLVVERRLDVRYVGQNFELPVAVPAGALDRRALDQVKTAFDAAHKRLYGYDQPEKDIELVTFRIKALLPADRPDLRKAPGKPRRAALAPIAQRQTFFEGEGGFVDCPVFARTDLVAGDEIRGPAIIEQMDTTTVLPPDFRARVDDIHNLFLSPA